ncbi:MAG: hypothetical protein WCE90_08000 [Candidatus Zixiibacteriota bacterium]
MKAIKCVFCRGTGVDPFELLSPLSVCTVCGGKGKVNVEEPYTECAFCRGTGVHPNTRLSCTVCAGKGVVTFREPKMTCPDCRGTGREHATSLPCLKCGGIGVIVREEGLPQDPTRQRSSSPGAAREAEVSALSSAKAEEGEGFLQDAGVSRRKSAPLSDESNK